jgi:hypothetical protein
MKFPDNCRSNISLMYPQSEGDFTFQAGNHCTRGMGRSFSKNMFLTGLHLVLRWFARYYPVPHSLSIS